MQVIKRNGIKQDLNLNKILKRLKDCSVGLSVESDSIALQTINGLYDGVTTKELDTLAAKLAAGRNSLHPDYSIFAANITISRLQKDIKPDVKSYVIRAKERLHPTVITKINNWYSEINTVVDFKRDFNFDFFGISTMIQTYLLKDKKGVLIELPQHVYLRVSLYLADTVDEFKYYYENLSNQQFSFATPILINGGTVNSSMISCSVHWNKGDDLISIMDTFKEISQHSAASSGIGLCVDNLRSSSSRIKSTGGLAHGIIPYAKIVQDCMSAYNQGGSRNGSCALYMSVWHKDIFKFLELKKHTGDEKLRARDIFLAVNIPDNFMKALKDNDDYYLFCPDELLEKGIDFNSVWGTEFEKDYEKAVSLGIGLKVKAQDVFKTILEIQIEGGMPYIHYIDHTNNKSNHQHFGKVKSMQLCIEITEYTDKDTTAQCTLASMVLPKYIVDGVFNFNKLSEKVRCVVRGLNKIIDKNKYTTEASKKGGLEQRAIAIGLMGLQDVFFLLDLPFTSDEARTLNKEIQECIYFTALDESNKIAKETNVLYKGFSESNYGKGILQFDMCGITVNNEKWSILKENIINFGLANSLVVANMPTATSSNLFSCYESFEPQDSNIFIRKTMSGDFIMFNKYLIKDLQKLNIWSEKLRQDIILNSGSIQSINLWEYNKKDDLTTGQKLLLENTFTHLKEKYKTVWEISQKDLIDMAVDRSYFVDQSQSMNLYMKSPSFIKLSSMHMYSWSKGLKTGIYYLRTKSKTDSNKAFALSNNNINNEIQPTEVDDTCIGCAV